MKKFFLMTIVCCLLVSCAFADVENDVYIRYNSFAKTFHAPIANKDTLNVNGNHYFFTAGNMKIIFEIPLNGAIRTGFVLTDDDSCAADFLSSCIAMISFFNEVSFDYYGIVLQQFMNVRMGISTIPYSLGLDAFQIMTSDRGKYSFVYSNNDMKINN